MHHDPDRHGDLAMRHVLGGLGADEARDFRSHLAGCHECRRRVAELRGIAADLQQAEEDERASLASLRTRTRAAQDDHDPDPGPAQPTVSERFLAIALVVGAVLLVAFAFWNFHLRDREASLRSAVARQQEVLDLLVTGRPVPVVLRADVAGTVVVRDDVFGIDVSGVAPRPADRLAIWLYAGDELLLDRLAVVRAAELPDGGLFAMRGDVGRATRVVLSLEAAVDVQQGPGDRVLLEADLRGAGAGADDDRAPGTPAPGASAEDAAATG